VSRPLTSSAAGRPTRAAPPARARRSGRLALLLALAAALPLAAGAIVAIVMLGDRGGAGPEAAGTASGQPDASAPAGATAVPEATTGAGPEPSSGAGSQPSLPGGEPLRGGFTTAPELCAAGDFSPVFGIVDRLELLNDYEQTESGFYQRSCVFTLGGGGSQGNLSVDLVVAGSGDGAAQRYDEAVAAEANRDPAREPVDGEWDESTALVPPTADTQAEVRVLARDGVLVVNLSSFVIGEAADADDLRAALVEVAEWIRDALRS
jgi:hypothetical protein